MEAIWDMVVTAFSELSDIAFKLILVALLGYAIS